ncbi:putative glycerol-3-phosphate dehydrogenase [Artemisia annua]|uniref:Putative glycerol-3-phosphate dehydrogenase n=1 Tax=Artemisia annua TaxID=35608 RepID=A0A2U1MBZ7_ARTAN|nr:putative glycerol-3-phosphate dehydrogenase [Artemisia annua]
MFRSLTDECITRKSVYSIHRTPERILITNLLTEERDKLAVSWLADMYVTFFIGRDACYGEKIAKRQLSFRMGDNINSYRIIHHWKALMPPAVFQIYFNTESKLGQLDFILDKVFKKHPLALKPPASISPIAVQATYTGTRSGQQPLQVSAPPPQEQITSIGKEDIGHKEANIPVKRVPIYPKIWGRPGCPETEKGKVNGKVEPILEEPDSEKEGRDAATDPHIGKGRGTTVHIGKGCKIRADEMRAGMSYFHEIIWKGVPNLYIFPKSYWQHRMA